MEVGQIRAAVAAGLTVAFLAPSVNAAPALLGPGPSRAQPDGTSARSDLRRQLGSVVVRDTRSHPGSAVVLAEPDAGPATPAGSGGWRSCALHPMHKQTGSRAALVDSCLAVDDSGERVQLRGLTVAGRTVWNVASTEHEAVTAVLLDGADRHPAVGVIASDNVEDRSNGSPTITISLYDARTGRRRWTQAMTTAPTTGTLSGPGTPRFDGIVNRGAQGWAFLVDMHDETPPSVSAVTPYRLQAELVDGATGRTRALGPVVTSTDIPAAAAVVPALNGGVADDVALLQATGPGQGRVVAVDSASGTMLWTSAAVAMGTASELLRGAPGLGAGLYYSSAGDADGPGVAVSTSRPANTISKLDPKTGQILWTTSGVAALDVHRGVAVVLTAGDNEQQLVCIADDGHRRWATPVQTSSTGNNVYLAPEPLLPAGDVQGDGWADVYSDWADRGPYHAGVTDTRTGRLLVSDPTLVPLDYAFGRGAAFAVAFVADGKLTGGVREGTRLAYRWRRTLRVAAGGQLVDVAWVTPRSGDTPVLAFATSDRAGVRHYTIVNARDGQILGAFALS